jgi:hypothetical protein
MIGFSLRSLLIRSDAHLAEAFDRLAFAKVLQLEQLPHLDLARRPINRGIRKAFGPFERFFLS